MRTALFYLAIFLPLAGTAPGARAQISYEASLAPADSPPSPSSSSHTANRLIGGIISYARWPDNRAGSVKNLCVVGTPRFTHPVAPLLPGSRVRVQERRSSDVGNEPSCDVIFLGRMSIPDRQQLISWVRGKSVLTITDDDPACAYGAMFCLVQRATNIGFSVNLDAVGRSQMRVDPRVLRIGSEAGR